MSDDNQKPLAVHGVPSPQGNSWLKEVKVDAARAAVENLRQQAERAEFERAKARGITPNDIIEKGKNDLKDFLPQDESAEFTEEDEKEVEVASDLEDSEEESDVEEQNADVDKPLSKMNKDVLKEIVASEKVEVAEDATKAELVDAIEAKRKESE